MATVQQPRAAANTATVDGLLRRREVDDAFLGDEVWDGRGDYSYIPPASADLRISPRLALHTDFDLDLDPITYQVLRNRFWSINLDHSDTIRRVSGSPVIVYMDDFNTALLTENADLFMCGPSIQWFAALGDLPIKWTLENRSENPGIEDEDVFLHNDAYIGCTHQMDTSIFAPVFWEGKLFSWAFSQCHAGDVGGPFPGSFNAIARDIYDEAVLVPPVKLVRGGELQQDQMDAYIRKSRTPELLALQIRSQIAGLRTVRLRMTELLEEYGPTVIKGAMRRMIRDCSQAVGDRLLQIPDGEWRERIYLGGLGPDDRGAHRFEVTVRKSGDRLTVTNAGTDPQYFSANGTYGTWRSGAIVAVTNFLAWDQLLCNAGALDHMTFEPVPGTLSVAKYPGATTGVGGAVASVYTAAFAVSKMLLAGPEELRRRANGAGGQAVTSFWFGAGTNRHGRFLVEAPGDMMAGSIGAFPTRDGVDAGGAWWWPNNTAGNVEDWEAAIPILYLFRREHPGSGGAGRWRGGNSVETAFIAHKTDQLTVQLVSVENAVNAAIGLSGGLPGHPGRFAHASDVAVQDRLAAGWLPADARELGRALSDDLERVAVKSITALMPNDVFLANYCGGGGYGDPLDRDVALVVEDIVEDRVPPDAGERHYGVVLGADGAIDDEQTAQRREQLRSERLAAATAPEQEHGAADVEERLGAIAERVIFGRPTGGGAIHWGCAACDASLGPATENYKLRTARLELEPHRVDPAIYPDPRESSDVDLVLRQHLCPSCGALLSTEFCKRDEEPYWDIRLELDSEEAER
jgi:N-methylhydantoinase B